ncbi:MAG: hypothetical protein QXW35_03540 [Candidatus Aenigmatarchaeota archaeon]
MAEIKRIANYIYLNNKLIGIIIYPEISKVKYIKGYRAVNHNDLIIDKVVIKQVDKNINLDEIIKDDMVW